MSINPVGKLYGIGVGPGDPELITLKGWRVLQRSPVVAFPSGTNGKVGIAQSIVADDLGVDQIQLAIEFPYVQDEAILQVAWQTAAEKVWFYLVQGLDVAFACEGDISFFSTFNYLVQTLQAYHPEVAVELIPGISSPMAAAAVLGIPLTLRAEKLIVLPALYHVSDLETALNVADVVVLMKVSSVYEQIWSVLERHHLLQQSYVVSWATLPEQVIYADLRDRPSLQLPYFSILLVFARSVIPKTTG